MCGQSHLYHHPAVTSERVALPALEAHALLRRFEITCLIPPDSLTSSRTVHSIPVEKISECLVVGSLGLKGATIDGQRELLLGGRSATVVEVVATLEEGLNVRIRRGLFHRIIILHLGLLWKPIVPLP